MPEPFSATAPLKSVKGTSSKPGVTFTGDEDTGLYNSAPNELAVSLGGSEKAKFTGTGVDLDGDITLDDGGTYSTTLQMVTPTANRTISFPDATGTVALVAGSSGQFLYNNAGALAGSNTLVIDGDGNITQSGLLINTATGVASGPPVSLTGTWYSGGTSTTTKPQLLIEPSGTTSTAWSTSGTGLGINAASGFTGRLLDLQLNGTSNFSVSSGGNVSVPLGSNAAPSVYFGTDTDTGVYSPGADQVAVATNGQGRLFVDASGNVGLNLSSSLGLTGYSGMLRIRPASSGAAGFFADNGAGDTWFGCYGGTSAADSAAIIYPSTGSLRISTSTGVGVGGFSEKIRVTSAGLVGIGTSSPSAPLHVNSPGAGTIATFRTDSDTDAGSISFVNGGNATGFIGDGSVLGLPDAINTTFAFRASQNRAISFVNGIAPTEKVRITSTGNVGIGTTSPSNQLEVGGDGVIRVRPQADNTSGSIYINHVTTSGNSYRGDVVLDSNGLAFKTTTSLNTVPTERARLDSSGRLLVGTSTSVPPNRIFQIAGTPNMSICANTDNNDGVTVDYIKSRNTSYGSNTIVQDGDTIAKIQFRADDGTDYLTQAAQIAAEVDGTPGANDMPGRLMFSVTADGAASPTEALRISSNRAITVSDGGHIVLGTGTGTKIGTSTSQKIGFFDETPIVQPTTGIAEAAFVENSGGTAVNVDSTFGGYTIQQVVQALQNLGLLA